MGKHSFQFIGIRFRRNRFFQYRYRILIRFGIECRDAVHLYRFCIVRDFIGILLEEFGCFPPVFDFVEYYRRIVHGFGIVRIEIDRFLQRGDNLTNLVRVEIPVFQDGGGK